MPSFLFSIPACISIFPPLNTTTPHLRLSVLYIYARPLLLPGSWLLPTYLPTYLQLPIQCPNQQQANKMTTQPHHNLNICLSSVGTRILRKQPKPHVYPPPPPITSSLTPTAQQTEFGQSFVYINLFHDDRDYLTNHLISRPLPHHHHHPQQRPPPPPGDSPYSSPSIKNHIINKIYSNSTLKTTSSSTIKIAIQDLS